MACKAALCAILSLSSSALAQSYNYEVQLDGKTVGKAAVSIKKTKQGYQVTSRYSYAMKGYDGRFENDYRVNDSYEWQQASAMNLATSTHYLDTLDATRTQLTVSMMQNGAQNSQNFPVRPDVELLPNLDPAAAQLLLLRAVTHPTANHKYNIVVPSFGEPAGSRNGSSGNEANPSTLVADQLPSSRQSYDAAFVKDKDYGGTLSGKTIVVHSFTLVFGSFHWTFLATEDNSLLQMNIGSSQPSYILQGFVLDPGIRKR